jgi:hypothetical protein
LDFIETFALIMACLVILANVEYVFVALLVLAAVGGVIWFFHVVPPIPETIPLPPWLAWCLLGLLSLFGCRQIVRGIFVRTGTR